MDSQDAADIVLLEREEMATFLHENGDAAASAGSDVEKCGKCGVTKAVCEMATRWKCMKCHIVHLLKYADLWWKDIVNDNSDDFLSDRAKLCELLATGQLKIPEGWKPDQQQLVHQEKIIDIVTKSLGSTRIYTHDSYKTMFARDPVQDDALQAEDWKAPGGATLRVFKVFHGPRDVWEQFHEEHTRSVYRRVLDSGLVTLSRDQQMSTWANRVKMILPDYSKLPDESHVAKAHGTPSAPANASAPTGPAVPDDEEDEMNERAALGLEPDQVKKRKSMGSTGGPKMKRSREEMFDEQYARIDAQFQELLMALRSNTPPTLALVNKLDRSAAKKIEDMKKAGLFDQASSLEGLLGKVALVREGVRTMGLYLSSSGMPNRKHEQAFLGAFRKMPLELRRQFSDSVQDHFLHLVHIKDLEEDQFKKAVENITSFRGEDKNLISMIELLLVKVINSSEDLHVARSHFKETIDLLVAASSPMPEEVADNLKWLKMLADEDRGEYETFDELLEVLDSKSADPCLRAILKEKHGVAMVDMLRESNKALQSRSVKAMELHNLRVKLSAETLLEVVAETAGLSVTDLDLELSAAAEDYKVICKQFVEACSLCLSSVKEGLLPILGDLGMSAHVCVVEAKTFFESSQIGQLESLCNTRLELEGKLRLMALDDEYEFNAQEMQCLQVVVQISKRLFAVMDATGGEGLSFQEWACTVSDKCLEAIEHGEAQCTGPVWSLCDAINAVPDMKALIDSAEACVGSWAVDALKAANDLATKCVPELLNKMVAKLGGLLLSSQEWFQEKCGQELFLPKEAPDSFWDKCANHPLPSDLKHSVEGMAGTMQKVGLQFDLSPVGTRFAHHKLQIYAALCKVAMQVNLESCGMIGIKAALKNLEKHIVEVSTLIVGPDGKDAVAGAREWFAASVIGPLCGEFLHKVTSAMNAAVAAIPEGVDVMVTNRNSARLRQVLFEKKTHEAATGENENFQGIMMSFDKILASGSPVGLLQGHQLAKIKTCQQLWKRIRLYTLTVAAVNLLLNKFQGRPSRERASLLREFKKKLDKGGIQLSKHLLTWLGEESSSGN